jgi:hypothetical protein
MAAFLVAVFLLIPLSLGFALLVAEVRDRVYLLYGTLLAWIALGPLTAIVHAWLPFTGQGDDFNYFDISVFSVRSIEELFDISRFSDVMEQPGYPILLSLMSVFTEGDLLSFKLFNLTLLIVLANTWYRIAVLLESAAFGRFIFVSILALTPLWFYAFFVLKDIAIVLLQSLFLLGLVLQWRRNSLSAWFLIALATFALLPFRSFLVMQNILVLLGGIGLKQFGHEFGGRILPLMLAVIISAVAVSLASNPEIMAGLGVFTEHRIMGSVAMRELSREIYSSSEMNRALFPLIYLFSEVAGLKPAMWNSFDAEWLRGVLALPWIFLVVPFFVFGVAWILKAPNGAQIEMNLVEKLRRSRFVTTPWGVLLLFVLSMIAISWIVGDTTRWRLSDMPVTATIAMAGWTFGSRHSRENILIVWLIGIATLFPLFYTLRGG